MRVKMTSGLPRPLIVPTTDKTNMKNNNHNNSSRNNNNNNMRFCLPVNSLMVLTSGKDAVLGKER